MANQDSQKSYHQYILKNRHANLQMIVKDAIDEAQAKSISNSLTIRTGTPRKCGAQFVARSSGSTDFHRAVPMNFLSLWSVRLFSTVSNVGNAAAGWDVTWGTTKPGRGHHLFGQMFNEYPFAILKIWLFCSLKWLYSDDSSKFLILYEMSSSQDTLMLRGSSEISKRKPFIFGTWVGRISLKNSGCWKSGVMDESFAGLLLFVSEVIFSRH